MRQKNQRKRQQRQHQKKQPQQSPAGAQRQEGAREQSQPQPQPQPQPQTGKPPERPPTPSRQTRPPHPPTGTARGHFPSRPAAHLAGLTDRAGHLAARLTPRASAERVLDLTLGTALLIAAAPAITLGALALTLRRGPGNVWERSPRTGLGGRVFTLRSLRTRRLRLDLLSRLPQVVRGELSLVGPAPLAPGDPRAAWPGARQWRQELRPGLTGLAQVRARSGMPWDDPALLDQHYAEHHGVVLDLAILAEAVRNPLRTALRRTRSTKAHLSDTDHRPPGYSRVD
ncbi:sugar transferase [Streptomyces cyaneofuscatus]|uniref:sugar transferase n=1 Tax=Streptomyces cyaneofuscatus TaxID=66883 RepID=UPI0037B90270